MTNGLDFFVTRIEKCLFCQAGENRVRGFIFCRAIFESMIDFGDRIENIHQILIEKAVLCDGFEQQVKKEPLILNRDIPSVSK